MYDQPRPTSVSLDQVPLYQAVGFYGLRCPALPITVFQAFSQHTEGTGERASRYQDALQQGYAVLSRLLFQATCAPFVQTAIAVASTDLYDGMQRLKNHCGNTISDEISDPRSMRIKSRLLRYILRMSARATPFGLFAGVSVGRFTDQTQLSLHAPVIQHMCIRPDMQWFLCLLQRIEQREWLSLLQWHMNATASIVGDHVLVPFTNRYGKLESRTVSLRAVPLLRHLLTHYRQPVPYDQLVADLHRAFPHVKVAALQTFLAQLWEAHVFQSTLHPSLLDSDPVQHALQRFPDHPSLHEVHDALSSILHTMRQITHQGGWVQFARERAALLARQRQLVPEYTQQPFQVDASLQMSASTLHTSIAETATRAAELLLRMGKYPTGHPALNQYRQAFLQKYGQREVCLLEVVSPEIGLGFPRSYAENVAHGPVPLTPLAPAHPPAHQNRDRVLGRLYAQALNSPERILKLTAVDIEALTQWTPEEGHYPPPSLDLFVQIQASSPEAIQHGTWESLIVHSMCLGGSSLSRFAYLFDEEERAMLGQGIQQEERLFPDCILADLHYLPMPGVLANVAIRPPYHAYEIAVHTTPTRSPAYVLPLDDLVVGVRHNRFYLRSRRLQKEVKVFQHHMLNTRCAPNICRLLLDITYDTCPIPHPFDWGTLKQAPFLPRVVVEKIVLSVARWTIRRATIHPQEETLEAAQWFVHFQQWRKDWRVPRYVYLSHLDHRLLLDLDHPVMVHELYQEVRKLADDASLTLQEMLPDMEHLWLRDDQGAPYLAELTIPVLLNAHHPRVASHLAYRLKEAAQLAAIPTRTISQRERQQLPDSQWLYLRLLVAPRFQNDLISGPLRTLIADTQAKHLGDTWFYLRYYDTAHHLRLRIHSTSPETKETLLMTLISWASDLIRYGQLTDISIDSYEQEIERYGGPLAMEAIEQIFSVNSEAMSAILATQKQKRLTLDPLIVAIFCLDQFFAGCGYEFPSRLSYLQEHLAPHHTYDDIAAFRQQWKTLTELLVPWRMTQDSPLYHQRALLLSLLSPQQVVLTQHIAFLRALETNHTLWGSLDMIMESLAHMLMNRLCGIDRALEQKAYVWWRYTLEAVRKRPHGA